MSLLPPRLYSDLRVPRARDRLPRVMKPLLELICEYTGYSCVTLIGGAFEGGQYKVGAVHHGEVKGVVSKDFAAYDPQAFRNDFVGCFFKFLRAMKGMSRRFVCFVVCDH